MSPGEWAYLKASYYLDPYGDDWERSSMISATVVNVLRSMQPGAEVSDDDLLPTDIFVPWRAQQQEADKLERSLKSLEEMPSLD